MMDIKSVVANSVSYWERRRVVYNAVLALLVVACWGADIVSAGPRQWLGAGLVLFLFAVIANALYCFAYPVDVALQVSPLNAVWQRCRWMLFAGGLVVASALALWIMLRPGMA